MIATVVAAVCIVHFVKCIIVSKLCMATLKLSKNPSLKKLLCKTER
jgi:hypothetical protein